MVGACLVPRPFSVFHLGQLRHRNELIESGWEKALHGLGKWEAAQVNCDACK